uniref:AAA+ ATPase domain-containing protein n=1 Tax=Nelumbo nucifera TaxID=4432 RepID=A0A822Y4I8_NELNU|nr:TPA_asm: hypothetical protein HUJ06_030312 [Nelumbo nucifera]
MPRSELSTLSSNVSPSLEDQMPEQLQATIGGQCSLLRGSLRPITLKKSDGCWFSTPEPKPTERTILNGVTGVVRPGDLLAMLGPSGSGKTTILTALAGRLLGKFSGSITYNGQTFSGSIKRKIGFVSQDGILYPHLTVLETLTYVGERIVDILQGLARGGRTVVTTIHQPSSQLYRMFDKLVVLSDGCPIYNGSASWAPECFGSIGYTPGVNLVNPTDLLLDLAGG